MHFAALGPASYAEPNQKKLFTTETRRHGEEKRFIEVVEELVKLIQTLGMYPHQRFPDLSDSVSPWLRGEIILRSKWTNSEVRIKLPRERAV